MVKTRYQKRGKLVGHYDTDSKLFSLNLIYDYPVRWSKFKVLRDFVQNFYDALGWRNWQFRFSHKIRDGRLLLIARDVDFSYDWLLHIGASTKRDSDGIYAGYFGEGFKIASLCALRDHGWDIEIISRNWELMVVATDIEIDGRWIESLAYRIWRSTDEKKDTVLCISPFNDETVLKAVLLSFYYPGNPLFGTKIWESSDSAVYFRSAQSKPAGYPATYDDRGQGIVFGAYQALGSFQYPLIFCLHRFRYNDRERSSFFRMDVVKLIAEVVSRLSPEASTAVLRALKSRWYDRPRTKYDFESWHGIIRTLVQNIAVSADHKRLWREEHPHLLAASQVKRKDITQYNRRRQALQWLRDLGRPYRLVQEAFLSLGYPALEEACEKACGFSVTRDGNSDEMMRIQMLERVVQSLFPDLFKDIELPPCKIIQSGRAVWQGMTTLSPIKTRSLSFRGLPVRYRLPDVALKQSLLQPNKFGSALSTYLHELAHMFGGDSSASFSHALSELMQTTLSNSRMVAEYQELWETSPAGTE
jgi:hypothetical protein